MYISEYFEENRKEYYDKLNSVDSENGWLEWIEFFLKSVETQANRNIEKIKKLQNLYDEYKTKINEIINSKNSIDNATINRYIYKLVAEGIIVLAEGKDRYIKYYFKDLVDLIQ